MKNHAFLIQAHKQPNLLARTLRVLVKDNHYFFVHVDAKTKNYYDFKNILNDIPNLTFVEPRVSVFHAGISQVYGVIALFNAARNSNVSFDYYHMISGQDYPIRSNSIFDNFFESTDHSFMWFDKGDKKKMIRFYRSHINGYHPNNTETKWRIFLQHVAKYGSFLNTRGEVPNLWGGWDWYSWNKLVFNFIMEKLDNNPYILKRFNYTEAPIETIFISLLNTHEEELKIEIHNPLRYVSWLPHRVIINDDKYRPYILTEEDFNVVKDSKAFFCRKVDERKSSKLLDMIDFTRNDNYDVNEHNTII